MAAEMRQFDTGATRNTDEGKYDYEGFMHPIVLERFAEYMNKHRKQADGKLRDADNWQKGIPKAAYMKSAWRHFFDWWKEHRSIRTKEGLEEALCALMFNVMGYLFEVLKHKYAGEAPQLGEQPGLAPWRSEPIKLHDERFAVGTIFAGDPMVCKKQVRIKKGRKK